MQYVNNHRPEPAEQAPGSNAATIHNHNVRSKKSSNTRSYKIYAGNCDGIIEIINLSINLISLCSFNKLKSMVRITEAFNITSPVDAVSKI